MKLEGRRESTNVEDRRGKRTVAAAGGIGIGGIIIYLIISLLGGDPSAVMEQMQPSTSTEYVEDGKDYSEVDVELMTFCKRILAGTEDVWAKEFQKMGRTYQPPKMVIFSDAVNSGCGNATSASGPFYCSADETVFLENKLVPMAILHTPTALPMRWGIMFRTSLASWVRHTNRWRNMAATQNNQMKSVCALSCRPTFLQAFGLTTTTRCSARWKTATLRKPSTRLPKSVTTTCKNRLMVAPCLRPSTTALLPNARVG